MQPSELLDDLTREFLMEKLGVINREFAPAQVIVFGSRARGTAGPDSDIDVIVVSERFRDIRYPNRMGRFLNTVRPKQPVDAICYTPEEFDRLVAKGWPFVKRALEDGIRVI
jgi:predicted nucleotidyltransferase